MERAWYRLGVSWLLRISGIALISACALSAQEAGSSRWTLARNSHFEIYSQGDREHAREALLWFEQLRTFFEQSGFQTGSRSPVRVIGFGSTREYDGYRLRPAASAYYVGTESRDYIVMPTLGANEFPIAAHEYAHLVLHASGFKIPGWLNEGLAEYFSTVRISSRGCEIGGAIPAHLQTLRKKKWMSLPELLALPADSSRELTRESGALFYAQSGRDGDARHLRGVPFGFSGSDCGNRVGTTWGGGPREGLWQIIAGDCTRHARLGRCCQGKRHPTSWSRRCRRHGGERRVIGVCGTSGTGGFARGLRKIGPGGRALSRSRARVAGKCRDFCSARRYCTRKGETDIARQEFKQALDQGLREAGLCYRYALLADAAGSPADEVRLALERALALKPDFDDARFKLALLESNAGDYQTAVLQLRAMKGVAAGRAYGYWSALAYALGELGEREEAKAAAERAMEHATTDDERARAAQIAYVAKTDLTVQFTRDANGHSQLVTTRVAHGAAGWNPFIEPEDHIRHVEGQLRSVECGGNRLRE